MFLMFGKDGVTEKATGLSETELCLIVSRFINSSLFYHKL